MNRARETASTPAEARLGVSRATVHTHLAEVFAKTKTRRSAELVRLLLQIGANLRDS